MTDLAERFCHLPGKPYQTGAGWTVRCACGWVTPYAQLSALLATNEYTVLHLGGAR
jgi:hypothetical protein